MVRDFPSEKADSAATIAPSPVLVKIEDFYALKTELETRLSRLEEREKLREEFKDKFQHERQFYIGILVASWIGFVGVIIYFLKR